MDAETLRDWVRQGRPLVGLDLRAAALQGADLAGALLQDCDLRGAALA
ncbi:pentapeptide repeat protein, partial [Bordetella bronchiseptica OSU553]